MKKFEYGVIGLGWFGEKHLEALTAIPNVELHAVCTRNATRLGEVASKCGIARTFTDYQAMLADPELEAVSVVTMWDQLASPAIARSELASTSSSKSRWPPPLRIAMPSSPQLTRPAVPLWSATSAAPIRATPQRRGKS